MIFAERRNGAWRAIAPKWRARVLAEAVVQAEQEVREAAHDRDAVPVELPLHLQVGKVVKCLTTAYRGRRQYRLGDS